MESIEIIKPNQQKLKGYYFAPAVKGDLMLIVCHGFRGAKENSGKIYAFANRLNRLGLGVVAFDFSGSGESEGIFDDITLSRQADDLQNVIDYVYAKYDLPIILLGRSFGGSTVLAGGTADKRVIGYILWSTPVKMQATFAQMLGTDYEKLIDGQKIIIEDMAGEYTLKPAVIRDFGNHNMAEYLQEIGERPVLAIHGQKDEVVDSSNLREIKINTQNSSVYLIEKADHRFTGMTKKREDITVRWLADTFFDGGVNRI